MQKYIVYILLCLPLCAFSQQYTGTSGLIHVPSADMDSVGDVRVGAHFLNKHFLPDEAFDYDGKYHSVDFYASITPFRWVEIGYTFILRKGSRGDWGPDDIGYHRKDRYISLKINPLREKEGKWWPAVAFGMNDPKTTATRNDGTPERNKNQIFGNYYVAASKHFDMRGHTLGIHLAYREWVRSYNDKWNGIVGGVTFQPAFQPNLRVIAEYTGCDVNVGFDWKLWKHLLVQSSLQNGKYFSGGLCFHMNLL